MTDMLASLREAQTAPEHYFGRLDDLVEDNLAQSGTGQHRDSDALSRSNFQVILDDLRERFGADVQVDSASHWAVGWVETILVPALIDPELGFTEDNVHPAFQAALDWRARLADYPVADESAYSELEYGEFCDYVTDEAERQWSKDHDDDEGRSAWVERVLEILSEDYWSADDLPWSALEAAFTEASRDDS